ncbi:uncharacterized protein LOC142987578 isoform X2 [Anticarsia gemmatalis]|uniref:uncharacterized protein LOC142987578 isoform X2 n=1 Tax=Anticarsia gemmatalis TaxID=129554 RepID=UPI003F75DBC4
MSSTFLDFQNSLSFRIRHWFLVTIVCGTSFVILLVYRSSDIIFFKKEELGSSREHPTPDLDDRYTIKTNGCTIPYLNYLDDSIKMFVNYPENIPPCRNRKKALLEYKGSRIMVKLENARYYGVKKLADLFCCYRAFYRPVTIVNVMSYGVDDRVKYKHCIYFRDLVIVNDEFVRVTCINDGKVIYEQFFLSATRKTFVSHNGYLEIPKNKSAYNVLILGVDSVSRLNLYRTMPKTVSFIKDNGGIDLAGYNKVGDNTFPNVIPLLMGVKITELKHTCMPHKMSSFDNCPFVWEWFKQAGYYTAFGEDGAALGTFNYGYSGFVTTPTDYYLHTFFSEAEKYAGYIGHNPFLCMNDIYFYKVLLDFVEDLTRISTNTKLFGYFWESTMSHNHLNYPMLMDDSYFEFFNKLKDSNYTRETVIFFVSDHGIRWGEIRSTKQGRLEERLPFLFILLPPSFRENYTQAYNNLNLNAKRLTSPFDVHATLKDLVDLNNLIDSAITTKSKESYAQNRSISLFLPIPSNRTCATAGIDDHWCTCHKGTVLPIDSPEGIEAGKQFITILNYSLRLHAECSKLSLTEILEITEIQAGTPDEEEMGWKEFLVVVRTTPGGGVFEATLRQDDDRWSLAGTISRLNLYGNQSHCTHNPQLKLYCYCH